MRSLYFTALFTASILVQTGSAASGPTEAQYIYGTEKAIPPDTVGSLDVTDPAKLQFQYGRDLGFKLPYSKIKNYEFSKTKGAGRSIAHVPIPKVPFLNRQEVLNLSYFTEQGGVNTASFRLSGKDLSSLQWTLSQRVEAGKKSAESASRTKLPESWWGDRYWRTTRNKAAWPEPPAEAVGTK